MNPLPPVMGGPPGHHSGRNNASVAQMVEHDLAKVVVEGSNPFARSIFYGARVAVGRGIFNK